FAPEGPLIVTLHGGGGGRLPDQKIGSGEYAPSTSGPAAVSLISNSTTTWSVGQFGDGPKPTLPRCPSISATRAFPDSSAWRTQSSKKIIVPSVKIWTVY